MPQRARGSVNPILLIILGVAAAIGLYTKAIRPDLSPKNFGVVDEGRVYRAGQLTPAAMRQIHSRHKIKTIIDLGAYRHGEDRINDPRGERRNQRVADALGVTRYVMPLYGDGTGNLNWYLHALKVMNDPANQPVLVHCGAGAERTGIAVALYEHIALQTPLEDALKGATEYRHNPRRNPHVSEILRTWGPRLVEAFRQGRQLDDPAFPPIPDPAPVNRDAAPTK